MGVSTVRELYGVMTAERALGGFVVTTGGFTEDARKFASGRGISTFDAHDLLAMVDANEGRSPRERPSAPQCPRCQVPMVQRKARRGQNAGGWFWGCTNYPSCREIKPM